MSDTSVDAIEHQFNEDGLRQAERAESKDKVEEGEDKDEDDETCGFCLFMKGGGCKKEFVVRYKLVVLLALSICASWQDGPLASHRSGCAIADGQDGCVTQCRTCR